MRLCQSPGPHEPNCENHGFAKWSLVEESYANFGQSNIPSTYSFRPKATGRTVYHPDSGGSNATRRKQKHWYANLPELEEGA